MCIGKYPTKAELEEVFELRGSELWRKNYNRTGKPKLIVNKKNTNKGYCQVGFNGCLVYYHAVIWILHNGDIPNGLIIDHYDGNKINNNIENLRLVTNRENQNNTRNNRNGRLPGCHFFKRDKKWLAQISLNGGLNPIHLGLYETEQEAHDIYFFVLKNIDNLNTKNEVQNYAKTNPLCTLRKVNPSTENCLQRDIDICKRIIEENGACDNIEGLTCENCPLYIKVTPELVLKEAERFLKEYEGIYED